MPMNSPPLPATLPLHETLGISTDPTDPSVANDQMAAATEIDDQTVPHPLSSSSGDRVVTVEEEEDEEERKAREELRLNEEWVKKMRGWLMVLATLAASVTYNAGLNPPGGFWQDSTKNHTAGNPVLDDMRQGRYNIFFACNASTFALSIAIIVLLLNQGYFHAEVRLTLLKGCVVVGMLTLVVAFAAGSTRNLVAFMVTVLLFSSTFLLLILCIPRIKKKRPARPPTSSQERDVELGARGQQTSPDY